MVIQAHNIGDYKEFIPNPQDYRTPTYDEMRSMSWQAICAGAGGLLYYSFFDLKRNPDVPFEKQWTNLKKIAAEIHSYSDILLSDEQSDSIIISTDNGDNSWLNWITRRYNNDLYIFIIDNGKSEGKITVRLYGNYRAVNSMNGYQEHPLLNNSQFTDIIGKLELKIYMIR